MRKFLLMFCLLFACSSKYQHELAVCAIFQNEAPWLKEWLDYHHRVLGVSHFYLYNNDSSDNYAEILQPYIERGIVELIDWSSTDPTHAVTGIELSIPWVAIQVGAYRDCLYTRALGKARWLAIIDIDEFIVPGKGVKAFHQMLRHAEKKKKGSVRLFWRVFGTSEVETLGKGELLIEKLLWRSNDAHPLNRHVKSIHRPEAIASCIVHEADKLHKPYHRYLVPRDQATVHHYWTRTGQVCLEKRKMTQSSHPELFDELHQVKDETILQYISVLR